MATDVPNVSNVLQQFLEICECLFHLFCFSPFSLFDTPFLADKRNKVTNTFVDPAIESKFNVWYSNVRAKALRNNSRLLSGMAIFLCIGQLVTGLSYGSPSYFTAAALNASVAALMAWVSKFAKTTEFRLHHQPVMTIVCVFLSTWLMGLSNLATNETVFLWRSCFFHGVCRGVVLAFASLRFVPFMTFCVLDEIIFLITFLELRNNRNVSGRPKAETPHKVISIDKSHHAGSRQGFGFLVHRIYGVCSVFLLCSSSGFGVKEGIRQGPGAGLSWRFTSQPGSHSFKADFNTSLLF